MGLSCTVCDHPQRKSIDSLLSVGVPSQRVIASQFNLKQAALDRHKRNGHLGVRIEQAIQRAEAKEGDEFLDHIRLMMAAGVKGVEVGQAAAARLQDDPATLYRMTPAFMAQSLRAAELLGQATGRLGVAAAPGGINIALQVVIPTGVEAAPAVELPAIDVQAIEPDE